MLRIMDSGRESEEAGGCFGAILNIAVPVKIDSRLRGGSDCVNDHT